MNSIKTKTTKYTARGRFAIAGAVFLPYDRKRVNIYVAWENQEAADDGFFCITKAECASIMTDLNMVMNYGEDVTHDFAARKLFPTIFKDD